MSKVTLTRVAQGSTPASNKSDIFVDTNDRRLKQLDDQGVLSVLADAQAYNWLRNGGFWFAQRQAPGTLTTYSTTTGRAFSADGWAITNENASTQYIRTDTQGAGAESGLSSQFYGNFTKITSTGKILVSQCIEGRDTSRLRGKTVRFQMYAKAIIGTPVTLKMSVIALSSSGTTDSLPATYVSAFGGNGVDPTLGTNLSYLAPKSGVTPDNATAQTNNVTCSVTTTWQRFGFVVDIPATAKNIVVMIHTDNQVIATNGFAISQVSLTEGYEVQDWSPLAINEELERVQRFYQKTFQYDVAPAQNAGLLGALRFPVTTAAAVATSIVGQWRFNPPMRVLPSTITFYNPSAANAFARNVTLSTDATATSAANASDNSIDVNCTGLAAWAIGNDVKVHSTADAEL